jgi:hypothetical protein
LSIVQMVQLNHLHQISNLITVEAAKCDRFGTEKQRN